MFDLKKRINRRTYWMGILLYLFAIALLMILLAMYPFNHQKDGQFEAIPDIPIILYLVGLAWYGICLTKQRANDINGENALLWMFVSLFLIGPIIGFIGGEDKSNKYGHVPKKINLLRK